MKTKNYLSRAFHLFVILVLISALLPLTLAQESDLGKIMVVDYAYHNGTFEISNISTMEGAAPDYKLDEAIYAEKAAHDSAEDYYAFDFLGADGNPLLSYHREYPAKLFYDEFDPETGNMSGGMVLLYDVEDSLYLEYSPEIKEIKIADSKGGEVLRAKVSDYLKTETGETPGTGPEGAEPPATAETQQPEKPKPGGENYALLIAVALLAVATGAMLIFRKKRTWTSPKKS